MIPGRGSSFRKECHFSLFVTLSVRLNRTQASVRGARTSLSALVFLQKQTIKTRSKSNNIDGETKRKLLLRVITVVIYHALIEAMFRNWYRYLTSQAVH
jgi:hypothetical protein